MVIRLPIFNSVIPLQIPIGPDVKTRHSSSILVPTPTTSRRLTNRGVKPAALRPEGEGASTIHVPYVNPSELTIDTRLVVSGFYPSRWASSIAIQVIKSS